MGNMTLLQMSCCKNEDHVSDRKGESEKAAQTCVVRWNPALTALTAPPRTLPAPPPAVPLLPRSL